MEARSVGFHSGSASTAAMTSGENCARRTGKGVSKKPDVVRA